MNIVVHPKENFYFDIKMLFSLLVYFFIPVLIFSDGNCAGRLRQVNTPHGRVRLTCRSLFGACMNIGRPKGKGYLETFFPAHHYNRRILYLGRIECNGGQHQYTFLQKEYNFPESSMKRPQSPM